MFPGSNNAHSVDSQEKAGLGSWVKISSQFPRKVSMIGDSRWQSACMPEEGHGWTEAPEASSRLAAAPQVPQCRCPTSPAANPNPPNHLLPYCSAPTLPYHQLTACTMSQQNLSYSFLNPQVPVCWCPCFAAKSSHI